MTDMHANSETQETTADGREPAAAAIQPFGPAALIAHQQRAAEAWIAAIQILLRGMQDVSKRHFMLQSALFEQALASTVSVWQAGPAGSSAELATQAIRAATETTLQSVRDTMATACQCQMDAVTVYRDRLSGSETSGTAACGRPILPQAAE